MAMSAIAPVPLSVVSARLFPLSPPCTSFSNAFFHGGSVSMSSRSLVRTFAKFQPFQQDGAGDESYEMLQLESVAEGEDSVLPQDLEGAVEQSSRCTQSYISAGGDRAIVELLAPELGNLDEEGAQQRLWDLSKLFLDLLQTSLESKRLKAIFSDAGTAALLNHQWADAPFQFGSLSDRRPVSKEDDVIILVAPDYQMLADVERIASFCGDEEESRPLVMWNPRLFSGDVGVGLNVRRLRNNFLRTFTTVYSLRPLPTGAVYRAYPGAWKIFLEDMERPGRYLLAKEQYQRPDPDDIDDLLMGGVGDATKEPSGLESAMKIVASFGRFMNSLSR